MLYGVKLSNEIYAPWKKNYIAYDHLKKLLKESVISDGDNWTEEDESHFVEELDKELEKVYSFETKIYDSISDRLAKLEAKVEQTPESVDPKDVEAQLENILEEAKQLDGFRRLNFTGFSKIVKKHDRLHPQYQVRPLLHVRLQALPFHSEDYSPLLYRTSALYKFLQANFASSVTQSARSQIGSVGLNHSAGYVTLQFWVHPENVMEVKTRILRRLPILVYNGDQDDDEMSHDPIVTSLYCDSPDMMLYHSQLERKSSEDESPTSLRFRWYGHLYQHPSITLEEHNEEDGRITRISLKEKQVDSFLSGNKEVVTKTIQKLRQKSTPANIIEDYESAANELSSFIRENHISPILRTVYKRSAFEIPGDDRVRVILDSDILFIREDSFNKEHPIRDPDSWHRQDLDQPNVNLKKILRKGESSTFPYSVLEVRLRQNEDSKAIEKLSWVEELKNSGLIKEVHRFTKYLQGVASLYGEDDRLETLPFWINDLYNVSESEEVRAPAENRARPPRPTITLADIREDELSDSEDSDLGDLPDEPENEGPTHNEVGFPTWVQHGERFEDVYSEDEEVVLPPGVTKPNKWIKNETAVKVEAKVWLANERTFNKWLHVTCLMSALTFTLYNSVESASNPQVATIVAYILFGLTLFTGIWGYTQYLGRVESINARDNVHFDNPVGPLVIAGGLLLAITVNFVAHYQTRGTPTMLGMVLSTSSAVLPE